MVNWLIVILFVVVAYFIINKFLAASHLKSKITIILVLLLLFFFYISASIVISKNHIEVRSLEGMIIAGKAYFKWIGHVIDNTKTVVGNAIKMDWGVNSAVK